MGKKEEIQKEVRERLGLSEDMSLLFSTVSTGIRVFIEENFKDYSEQEVKSILREIFGEMFGAVLADIMQPAEQIEAAPRITLSPLTESNLIRYAKQINLKPDSRLHILQVEIQRSLKLFPKKEEFKVEDFLDIFEYMLQFFEENLDENDKFSEDPAFTYLKTTESQFYLLRKWGLIAQY